MANDGSAPGGPVLSVLGEFVVDLLPVPAAGHGPEGTAPPTTASTSSGPPTGKGPTRSSTGSTATRTGILHVGSISRWTPPGGEAIARLVERLSGRVLIGLAPDIRPMLADGPVGTGPGNSTAAVHRRRDRLVARADVVKVSAEDLARLEPGDGDLDDGARRWASRGLGLVLLTDGGAPLRIARPGRPVLSLAPPRVAVVDTVGAGDTPAAGLRTGLLAEGVSTRPALEALTDERLLEILDDALLIAALNCTRVGVDPPTRAEVAEHRRAAG